MAFSKCETDRYQTHQHTHTYPKIIKYIYVKQIVWIIHVSEQRRIFSFSILTWDCKKSLTYKTSFGKFFNGILTRQGRIFFCLHPIPKYFEIWHKNSHQVTAFDNKYERKRKYFITDLLDTASSDELYLYTDTTRLFAVVSSPAPVVYTGVI